MSKFHSTVDRRTFMKGLGFGAAGLGAAAAAAPVFHDLDELASSVDTNVNLPWWVKQRDFGNPSNPTDWSIIKPFDKAAQRTAQRPGGDSYIDKKDPAYIQRYDDVADEFDPTYNWKDPRRQALKSASSPRRTVSVAGGWIDDGNAQTPESKGYPKWTGTPEENRQLMLGAIRYFGGSDIGVMQRDDKLEKIMYSDTKWADITEPDDSGEFNLMPNSFQWAFVFTLRQHTDLTMRQFGSSGQKTTLNPMGLAEGPEMSIAYFRLPIFEVHLQYFLRGLGYQGLAGGMRGSMPGNAIATLSGVSEHARMGAPALHPKYGVTIRGSYKQITNLPLEPTPPISAGMFEFCKNCGLCADICPAGLIQQGEPTWDGGGRTENRDGYLGWRTKLGGCVHCPFCHRTCPFNSLEKASFIHELVKATVGTISIPFVNTFLATMDKTFNYGHKSESDYWDVWHTHPSWGFDGTN